MSQSKSDALSHLTDFAKQRVTRAVTERLSLASEVPMCRVRRPQQLRRRAVRHIECGG